MYRLCGDPDLLDAAVAHQDDAIGQGHRLLLIVRDVEHGRAELAVDPPDLGLHLLAQLLVERAKRFVHQHDRRLVDDASGQRHALLLSAREFPRQSARCMGQLHERERLLTRLSISLDEQRRMRSGNAMFSKTFRCGNSA